jgi:hypothetical protein
MRSTRLISIILQIVDDHSGFVGAATERKIPLPGRDHRDMCRYGDSTDPGLLLIMGAIKEVLAEKVSSTLKSRYFFISSFKR